MTLTHHRIISPAVVHPRSVKAAFCAGSPGEARSSPWGCFRWGLSWDLEMWKSPVLVGSRRQFGLGVFVPVFLH
jgi:hypothetical protein